MVEFTWKYRAVLAGLVLGIVILLPITLTLTLAAYSLSR